MDSDSKVTTANRKSKQQGTKAIAGSAVILPTRPSAKDDEPLIRRSAVENERIESREHPQIAGGFGMWWRRARAPEDVKQKRERYRKIGGR